jgi:hypothetical protein
MNQHQRPLTAEMPERERPISEQFRLVALSFVDAEAAADLREEMKTTTLEQMKTAIIEREGPMADNRAERLAKSSQDWIDYIKAMCADRANANKLKYQLEYIRMRFNEWQSHEATARHESRLGGR